jgi:hypothetical protein
MQAVESQKSVETMQQIIQRERWPGEYITGPSGVQRVQCVPLVTAGQQVQPDQPVMRLERLSALDIPGGGERVVGRDEVAPAGLFGRVVRTTARGGVLVESLATVLQGTLGVGNQIAGILTPVNMEDESSIGGVLSKLPAGAILAIPQPLTFAILRRAIISGVGGIIGGSVALSDLEGFLHADLLSILNSTNIEQAQGQLPAMTLILTEGIGQTPMAAATFELLQQHAGSFVLASGVTSTRHNLMPEVVISSPQQADVSRQSEPSKYASLNVGTRVRVTCGEQQGATGIIEYFFLHEQLFTSGVRSRAVRLYLDSGASLMLPLTHVQPVSL